MEPETKAEATPENKSDKRRSISPVAIIVPTAIVAAAAVAITVIITSQKAPADTGGPKIGYAQGAVAMDEDALQKLVDEMAHADGDGLVTEYKNDAISYDGENFSCYVGNSPANLYDMYIQMFADEGYTDQIFLSELLRPGTVFKEITLEHSLPRGTHKVYTVFTQVEEDLETIHGQVVVTMNFTVAE